MSVEYDTRAEFLLSSVMSDIDGFVVEKKGRFYRGYSHDLMNIDEDASIEDSLEQIVQSPRIELSRNGLLRFLPEAMLCDEDCLRLSSDDTDDIKKRIEDLRKLKADYEAFFSGFDTFFFREEFHLMRTVSKLETNRASLLIKEIYGVDVSQYRSRYVYDLSLLRLYSRNIKGAISILGFFVHAILGEQIEIEYIYPPKMYLVPSVNVSKIRFIILIKGLNVEKYCAKMEEFEEFFYWLQEWFLPFDLECDYCIKDREQEFTFSENSTPAFRSMILDYNTQFLL